MSSSAAPSETRVTLQDVLEAHTRIKDSIHKTPVIRSTTLNEMSGRLLYFKCENLQKAGAFKVSVTINTTNFLTKNYLNSFGDLLGTVDKIFAFQPQVSGFNL